MQDSAETKISIIIPAYNSEKTIAQALRAALSQQGVGEVEVIVVDDGSKDRTAEIVKSFPEVKYFYQENAGPAAARNYGAKEAGGGILFFTDADCIPHPDWIVRMLPFFSRAKVAVVSGSYGIANPENLLARCIHKEILFRHYSLMPENPKSFGSYNFGVRKKVFETVGGFEISYRYASGEDNDLSYKIIKLTFLIYFEKEAKVDHFYTTNLLKYLKEQYRHGFWRVKMYLTHPSMSKGDDYTFWKDIIEIPLVFGILGIWLNPFFGVSWLRILSLTALFLLILLEISFGVRIVRSLKEGLFLAFVMFLRSFARGLGFIIGIVTFPFQRASKGH